MHIILITSSVLLYFTILTTCQESGSSADIPCTSASQCQQIIQQLQQQVQEIESTLAQITNEDQNTELPESETPKKSKEEFVIPSSGLHSYTQAIPSEGAFYIWVQGAGQDNVAVYLSSTCNCNNNPTYFPATQTRNCQSFTSGASGLTETATRECKVSYTVATISPTAVSVWFYPLKNLLRNKIQKVIIPYDNSYRFFTETIEAKDLPATFYLLSFGEDPSINTQVFATVDCLASCVQTPYFTHFPTYSSNCYSSSISGTEPSYLSITLTQTCNIYYSIFSSKEGVSAQLGMYVYPTIPVDNNTLATVNYPIPNTYRTFYQDVGPYSVFYVHTYGLGQAAGSDVPVYVTSNCTGSCLNSADYTDFPTSEQNCWKYTFNSQYKSFETYCRVYYSLFSLYQGDSVELRTLQYPLQQIPLNTPTLISFPFDNSYRWFYAEIDSLEFGAGSFNIDTFSTDPNVIPVLYVTQTCTAQCDQPGTHFPMKSHKCWTGYNNFALNLEGTNLPCRVYYSIFSTKSGYKVDATTSLTNIV